MSRHGASRRWAVPHQRTTLAVCLAVGVVGLTTTAITVGTRGMADELGVSLSTLGWIVNAYLLTAASLSMLGGRLGDIIGRAHTFVAGVATFALGSLVGVLAPGATVLIVARTVQGVGAALLLPASIEIVAAYWPEGRESRGFSARSLTYATAFALGPLVGGLLTDQVSWRWIFGVGFAMSVAAGVAALPLLAVMGRGPHKPTRDWRGAALAALLVGSVVVTAERVTVWGARSAGFVAMAGLCVLLAVALVWVERHTRHPLIHPALLRNRRLAGANVATFGASLGMVSLLYFFNVFAQSAAQFDATVLAVLVALMPFIASMVLFAHLATYLRHRIGVWAPAVGGMALMVAGFVALSQTTVDSTRMTLALPLIVCGVGTGVANAGLTGPAVQGLAEGRLNEAAGIVSLTRFLGSAVALAVGTSTYLAVSVGHAVANGSSARSLQDMAIGGDAFRRAVEQLDVDLQAPFTAAVEAHSAAAFADTMRLTAVLVALSLVASAWLMRPVGGRRARFGIAQPRQS